MTSKEKAEQLFQLYLPFVESGHIEEIKYRCKQCALIAVDEMMEVYTSACVAMGMLKEDAEKQESKYLQEVKQEIENL